MKEDILEKGIEIREETIKINKFIKALKEGWTMGFEWYGEELCHLSKRARKEIIRVLEKEEEKLEQEFEEL